MARWPIGHRRTALLLHHDMLHRATGRVSRHMHELCGRSRLCQKQCQATGFLVLGLHGVCPCIQSFAEGDMLLGPACQTADHFSYFRACDVRALSYDGKPQPPDAGVPRWLLGTATNLVRGSADRWSPSSHQVVNLHNLCSAPWAPVLKAHCSTVVLQLGKPINNH